MNTHKLKAYLKEKDITYEKLSEISGLHYNSIQKILATGNCTLGSAKKIIESLKMPPKDATDIFFGEDVSK